MSGTTLTAVVMTAIRRQCWVDGDADSDGTVDIEVGRGGCEQVNGGDTEDDDRDDDCDDDVCAPRPWS